MSTKKIIDLIKDSPLQKPLDNDSVVSKLRVLTGMGIEISKEALQHCGGDLLEAIDYIKAKAPKF